MNYKYSLQRTHFAAQLSIPSPESTQSMSTRPGSRLVTSARRRPGQPSTSARPRRSLITISVSLTGGDIQHTRSGSLYAKSFIISSPNGQERRKGYTEETPTMLRTLTLIWIILTKFQHFSTPDMNIRIILLNWVVVYMFKHTFTRGVVMKAMFHLQCFPLSFLEMMVCREVMWPNRFPVKYCPSSRPNQLNIFCDKWRHHIFIIFSN